MKFSSAEIWRLQMIYWNVINIGKCYDQIFLRYLSYQMIWCYHWSGLSSDVGQIKHVDEPVDLSSLVWFHFSEIFRFNIQCFLTIKANCMYHVRMSLYGRPWKYKALCLSTMALVHIGKWKLVKNAPTNFGLLFWLLNFVLHFVLAVFHPISFWCLTIWANYELDRLTWSMHLVSFWVQFCMHFLGCGYYT